MNFLTVMYVAVDKQKCPKTQYLVYAIFSSDIPSKFKNILGIASECDINLQGYFMNTFYET